MTPSVPLILLTSAYSSNKIGHLRPRVVWLAVEAVSLIRISLEIPVLGKTSPAFLVLFRLPGLRRAWFWSQIVDQSHDFLKQVANLNQNGWTVSVEISGRVGSGYVIYSF